MEDRNIKKIKLLIIFILLPFFFGFSLSVFKRNSYKFTSNNIIENTKDYTLRANIPITNSKELNKKMSIQIHKDIKQFKEIIIENKKIPELKDRVYDFRGDFQDYLYKNILSFHFTVLMFTGGAHYSRNDYMYHYNYIKNKEVFLNDFFKDKSNYLEIISKLSYEELMKKNIESNLLLDSKWVKEGTTPLLKNFELFYFDKEGLNIIFPPYQVGPWSDGEIPITISYQKLEKVLK